MQTIDAALKMTKARTSLILSQPFFGSLALRMPVVPRTDIKTCAVDGRSLFYNPAYVDSLTMEELVGVLAHEVLHCALSHTTRRGGRDPKKWNAATDIAINSIVLDAKLVLPAGVLIDRECDGLSAEEIFARKNPPKQPDDEEGDDGKDEDEDGDQDGQGGAGGQPGDEPGDDEGEGGGEPADHGCGEVLDAAAEDGSPAGEAEREALENEWRVATLQAAQQAKAAGMLPGEVKRMADEMRQPKEDWRDLLRRFCKSTAKEDFSWSRPNRRHVAAGLYLPSRHSEGMGEMVIVLDTSGSLDESALARFKSEIDALIEDQMPERVHVLCADANVAGADVFEPGDYPVRFDLKGGGGTAFRPTFEWIEEQGIDPACVVYFTDLDCTDFGPEPGYPVMWLTTKYTRAPWGEVVKLQD